MIFYYIDDSMLARNEFATAVLHRFECWMEHHPADLVLVSTAQKNHPQLEHFVDAMKRTTVLASPAQFEFQGVRGDLRNGFLCVEGFPEMQSFSGSFVAYDTKRAACERIYLELFMEHDASDMDSFVEKLEEMLSEKLQMLQKKKSILS